MAQPNDQARTRVGYFSIAAMAEICGGLPEIDRTDDRNSGDQQEFRTGLQITAQNTSSITGPKSTKYTSSEPTLCKFGPIWMGFYVAEISGTIGSTRSDGDVVGFVSVPPWLG